MAIAADTNEDEYGNLAVPPDPEPGEPDYAAYGLPTPAEVREDIGRWGAWRYKREVNAFFERVDEDAFYRGLGGMAVKKAGFTTEEVRETRVEETSSQVGDARRELRALDQEQSRITAAMNAARAAGNIPALAAAQRQQEDLNRRAPVIRNRVKKAVENEEFDVAKAEDTRVHDLASEEYIAPRTRKERRAAKKMARLAERTKKHISESDASEKRAVFLAQKNRKFKDNRYTVAADKRAAARDLRTGELHDSRWIDVHGEPGEHYDATDYDEEKGHLKHRRKHQKKPGHEIWLPLNEHMDGSYTPSKRTVLSREAAEAGVVEIERRVNKKILTPEQAEELIEKLRGKTAKRYEKASKKARNRAEEAGDRAEDADRTVAFNEDLADSAEAHLREDDAAAAEAEERAERRVHRLDLAKRFRRSSLVGTLRGIASGRSNPKTARFVFGINHANEEATATRYVERKARKLHASTRQRRRANDSRQEQTRQQQRSRDLRERAEEIRGWDMHDPAPEDDDELVMPPLLDDDEPPIAPPYYDDDEPPLE